MLVVEQLLTLEVVQNKSNDLIESVRTLFSARYVKVITTHKGILSAAKWSHSYAHVNVKHLVTKIVPYWKNALTRSWMSHHHYRSRTLRVPLGADDPAAPVDRCCYQIKL